jgi:RNA polymerase sigma-70 factor (ECF subfamily)
MEKLLEHAMWLRRLAASLVGDGADDAVQDTWVAALRRPPSEDRPLRPWFARVLRNAGRFRRRSDANRAAREAAVAAEAEGATPTSEELLARHELQQLLARFVTELAEPFRTAILLRYAEGLEPKQIARRLGVPPGTVRWRIKEGLERLRVRLDEEHGGNRKTWLLALAPIALWPRGSRAAGAAAVAAAVACVVIVAVATRGHARSEPAMHASAPRAVGAPTSTRPTATSWFAQAGVPARHVMGRVVRDGAPVANAEVRLIADGDDTRETRSDANGRFDFGEEVAREVTLGAAAGDALGAIRHVDLRDPGVAEIDLTLSECHAWITGKVSDAAGPIAHARVLREDVIGTETDANGAYELCALPTAALVSQLDVVVRADGYGAVTAGVAPTGRIERDFVLAPEATITGTAAAGAALWLEPDRDSITRTGEHAPRLVALADRDGRFRFTGASGGRYQLGGAAHGQLAVTTLVAVEPGGTIDVAVRMVPAATVHGRVTVHGSPVAGARVAVASGTVVVRHDDPAKDAVAAGSAVTQADGSFVLEGVPVGMTAFRADPVRIAGAPRELVAGDNTVALEGVALGRIRGVVRRHGAPVPFARVDIGGIGKRGGLTADAAGHYELDGLELGSYGVYADDARRTAYFTAGDVVKLGEGETREYDVDLKWGARVSGTVVDGGGKPVANANVRFDAMDGEQGRCATDARGAFECASLQGDKTYTAAVYPADSATRAFAFVRPSSAIALADDAAVSGVVLAIDPRTVGIDGSVVDDAGVPVVDAVVHASGGAEAYDAWIHAPVAMTDVNGRFHFDRLPPGDYELRADSGDGARTGQARVAAGASAVKITLARPRCAARGAVRVAHELATPVVWDDRIELIGWEMPETARIGDSVEVTLVFRARARLLHAWTVFAHFDGSAHRQSADHDPVGDGCATATWEPGDIIVDRFAKKLAYAETFTLHVGFFRPSEEDGPWVNLTGPSDAVRGVELGTVVVAP